MLTRFILYEPLQSLTLDINLTSVSFICTMLLCSKLCKNKPKNMGGYIIHSRLFFPFLKLASGKMLFKTNLQHFPVGLRCSVDPKEAMFGTTGQSSKLLSAKWPTRDEPRKPPGLDGIPQRSKRFLFVCLL